jgi:hypothetical protein
MTRPPAPDPLGKDLLDLVVRALSISLTTYERSTLARLVLYADPPDVAVLASLIDESRKDAAEQAVRGTLWE